MRSSKLFPLVLTGLFAALIFAVTAWLPRIPVGTGYVHLGDAVSYLAASILPLPLSAVAAGLGAALADVTTGYAQWAPFTLVIKVLMVLAFTAHRAKLLCGRNIIAVTAAIPITVAGYYMAAWLLTGSMIAPLPEMLGNVVQAGLSMVIYLVIANRLDKLEFKTRVVALSVYENNDEPQPKREQETTLH
jgi:uncharacterized repeat protein (TIGR04002 family)